jgi:molybdopterin/thiamine biosynthesis adenylyltransferase
MGGFPMATTTKFAHEESFRGKDLLSKLASKQIVLCGAGALGSNLADMLCRQGVSKIRVIDLDRVEGHNINTQLFGDADVGALKVNALKNRLFRDTGIEIDAIGKELNDGSKKKFLKDADLIIDVFDNQKSRRLVTEFCTAGRVPCLHGGMFEGYGEIVWNEFYNVPQDAPEGTQDVCAYPLARNLAMFVTTILAEEAMDFLVAAKARKQSWSITLKDLQVRKYR